VAQPQEKGSITFGVREVLKEDPLALKNPSTCSSAGDKFLELSYLVLIFSLNHCWPLCPKTSDGLEDIYYSLVLHSFKDYAKGYEHSSSANTRTIMIQ